MAVRAAAELKRHLGVDSDLQVGNPGEFTVWVDGRKVAEKERGAFPPDAKIVEAVRAATAPRS